MAKEYINMVQLYERNEKQLTAKQLYEIQQAEIRHERALKRKRREERIARLNVQNVKLLSTE